MAYTIHSLNSRTVKVCQSVCKLPHCRSETTNFYFNVGAKIGNFKFEVTFNKFASFRSKYYLHEVGKQEEHET
jgi:hypothetical protein